METNLTGSDRLLLAEPFVLVTPGDRFDEAIASLIAGRRRALDVALTALHAARQPIAEAAALLVAALGAGRKVLTVGNGGSAAEAQHFATELVGRFRRERDGYAVMALTADSALLTAVANDYGYAEVFARQVRAFGQPGDVLVAFSTSGESDNVVCAAEVARARGVSVVALTADRLSRLDRLADVTIKAPVVDTPLAQELHTIVTHVLCEIVETRLATLAAHGGEE